MKNHFYTLVLFSILLMQTSGLSQFWVYQVSGTTQHLNDVHMINSQTGWICGDAGTLLKTTNGGQNWVQVNATANDLNSIVFKDAVTGVAVGDDGIIIRTVDGGASWSVVPAVTIEQFRKVSWNEGSMVYAAGDDGLAAVSADDGATWVLKNTGTTLRFRGIAAAGTNKVWAVGNDGVIKYSSDGGNSWATQTSGITNQDLHDIQFVNETTGFAGGSGSNFIYTNNGGQTWTLRNSGIFFDINGIYFQDENIGWGVSLAGTIFFTIDGGVSWTSQPCGSASTLKEAYFIHQGKGWTVGENGTIVMYDNPSIPVELTSFNASITGNDVTLNWSTASEINNHGFEIERNYGSLQTTASNTGWVVVGFSEGAGNTTEMQSYSFTDKSLASGKYLYRLKQVDFDGTFEYSNTVEVELNHPERFELSQNYPNPFNPSTKISYHLPSGSDVTLKVYDVIGNEVATLVQGFKDAGSHSIEFSADNLGSGIYFYKLTGIDFVQTKKMILIR
ncbi:MAG: YCF48-related protein [Ignavibacteriaceae bacterium]